MRVTALEILSLDDGRIRIVEVEVSKGKVRVNNYRQGAFNRPVGSFSGKELKRWLKGSGIRVNPLMIILPEDAAPAELCEIDAGLSSKVRKARLKELAAGLCAGFVGEIGGSVYGIISDAGPEGLMRVFKGLKVKYVLPKLAAYSLLNIGPATGSNAVIDIDEDAFTFLAYDNGVLVWTSRGKFSDAESFVKAVKQDLAAARNRKIYLDEIFLIGDCNAGQGDDLPEKIKAATEIPCSIYEHYQDGEVIDPELTTAITAAARMFGDKPKYPPVNCKPAQLTGGRLVSAAVFIIVALLAVNLAVNIFVAGRDYLAVKSRLEIQAESVDVELQLRTEQLAAENYKNEALLGYAADIKAESIQLGDILNAMEQYRPQGIGILSISENSVTGYGGTLNTVTQFITELSAQLGREVEVRNILQIKLPGEGGTQLTGFEVMF